ncbi:MAG: DUF2461 domain-containing protein [Fusobacteriaceae bacterium]|jgi:uncharacterized protein (TIGR02453 family)|nr:DUF2461 domain-containing protein [Fusobacteriaceae bacterium]
METKQILDFLRQLRENNSLAWMKAHKDEYETVKRTFEDLVGELVTRLVPIDEELAALQDVSPRDLMFRLNRDTRFSADKTPYMPSFRVHMARGGKAIIPLGYYLNVEPDNIFVGAGMHSASIPGTVQMIRNAIAERGEEFLKVIENKKFAAIYPIQGEKLKNVPREYDAGVPAAEYLKFKSLFIQGFISEADFLDREKFFKKAGELVKLAKPFTRFLNEALAEFRFPDKCVFRRGKR